MPTSQDLPLILLITNMVSRNGKERLSIFAAELEFPKIVVPRLL